MSPCRRTAAPPSIPIAAVVFAGFALALLVQPARLSAQTSSGTAGSGAGAIALFPVEALSGDATGSAPVDLSQYVQIITGSLRNNLVSAGFSIDEVNTPSTAPSATAAPSAPTSRATPAATGDSAVATSASGSGGPTAAVPDAAFFEVARESGARYLVTGHCSSAADRLVVQVSAYDVASRQIVGGETTSARTDLSIYNTVDAMSSALAKQVSSWSPLPDDPATTLRSLKITGLQSGTLVSLPGGRVFGTVSGGMLNVPAPPIPVGDSLLLELQNNGYYGRTESIQISSPDVTARVRPLRPVAKSMVVANWTLGQLAGMGLSFRNYLVPDEVFLSYGAYGYAQLPPSLGGALLFHLDLSASAGTYLFFPPQSLFRFALSAGFGGIVTVLANGNDFVDPYISFFNPEFELNFPGFVLFLQVELPFVVPGAGVLETGIINVSELPLLSIGVGIKR